VPRRIERHVKRSAAAALLVLAVVGGCTSSSTPRHVRISVTPSRALLERPIAMAVTGLPSGGRATITASAVDDGGATWRSSTTFVASAAGVVSIGQPAVAGSYVGVDPMGVFDRMKPVSGTADAAALISPVGGYPVSLSVWVSGKRVAGAQVQRVDPLGSVVHEHRYRMSSDGIYADLYEPARSTGRRPGVLLFDGSAGGLREYYTATLLAAEGYPAMALAYFREPGLPPSLKNVPLEYFVRALDVLRHAADVDARHLVVWGVSRGSEAALLLGTHFPQLVHGVVAAVPSSVVYAGYPDSNQPAWTLHGKGVPYSLYFGDASPPTGRGVIPVERIHGPVLLICGGEDAVWPSCRYSDAIVRRLAAHGKRGDVTELKYPTAGHGVGEVFPYVSVISESSEFGGTVTGDVLGRNDAWQHVLAWLHTMH
jgi:dienelactone hydrolase